MPQPYRLLQDRNFLLFLATRAGTVFGTVMLSVAVGWHIYSETGNVLDLGLVGLFQFAPMLLLFLFSGWLADRISRRAILAVSNIIDCIVVFGIGTMFLAPDFNIWGIFLLLSLHGIARSFTHPAQQALLPNLVPKDVFPRAMATASSVLKFGQLGGPALAGVLIAWVDLQIYFLLAAFFLFSAVTALFIQNPKKRTASNERGLAALFGGFNHIWREKLVLASISIDLMVVLFGSVIGLLPVFAKDILHVGPEALGVMRAAPGVGALCFAILLSRYTPTWRMGPLFLVSLLIFSASIFVFGFSRLFWLSLVALLVYGAADMLSVYIRMTLVQIRTPDALRGRVSAINSLTINASNEIGDFRAGTMAAWLGVIPAVIAGAAMTVGVTVLWWAIFPQLRQLKKLE